ncbi:hypothetical protein KUH03_22955 [Sphingobacterium sp. E70]|uniref:hypothetical protein n=1 Tax=Sphingobacterium sp. E70 TaxID=2853439 RepID=UPI00211C6BA2|nr:hypothetical protein [Sphingobacterium sp. E70]ULT22305.1 hypothetical protein KUH03_22955 [Sphingobacterium sp. E70]
MTFQGLDINCPGGIGVYVRNSNKVILSNIFFRAIESALVESEGNQGLTKENSRLANGKSI